jgi:hypothetical protein
MLKAGEDGRVYIWASGGDDGKGLASIRKISIGRGLIGLANKLTQTLETPLV